MTCPAADVVLKFAAQIPRSFGDATVRQIHGVVKVAIGQGRLGPRPNSARSDVFAVHKSPSSDEKTITPSWAAAKPQPFWPNVTSEQYWKDRGREPPK